MTQRCNVTGLTAHWRVDFGDDGQRFYNSVRTMVNELRQTHGIDITDANMFAMDRQVTKGKTLSPERTNRFTKSGVTGIEKIGRYKLF